MAETFEPQRIERLGETAVKILWADGHQSIYSWSYLRGACPCAACRHAPPAVDPTVKPMEIRPVGRYAMNVQWSDGHTTGIFSHEYLRLICPCEECKPKEFTEG